MARIYSTQLAQGTRTSSGVITVYTVPSGVVTVVRSIELACFSSGTGEFGIQIVGGAIIHEEFGLAAPAMTHTSLRAVLTAGEQIEVFANALDWTYLISGYQLS